MKLPSAPYKILSASFIIFSLILLCSTSSPAKDQGNNSNLKCSILMEYITALTKNSAEAGAFAASNAWKQTIAAAGLITEAQFISLQPKLVARFETENNAAIKKKTVETNKILDQIYAYTKCRL